MRTVFLICLLIGSNSQAFVYAQAFYPAPHGTVVLDRDGGQHYYEGTLPAGASAYYKPYVSSLVDALSASATMALLYYTTERVSSWLPEPWLSSVRLSPARVSYLMVTVISLGSMWFYYGDLKVRAANFWRLGEEDSRYVIQLMATTAYGYSPLHIQRVFDTREHRLFYRIAALPEVPEEAKAKTAGLDDAMWELARVLRDHKSYIELNFPQPQGCRMPWFYCDQRRTESRPKTLTLSVYPDGGETRLPVSVTFTSTDNSFWLEDILTAYEHELAHQTRSSDRNNSDNHSFNSSDSVITDIGESASGLWIQSFKFDSPLSHGWIRHLTNWLENVPLWGGEGAEQWSEVSIDDACISEPCPVSRGVIIPDKNGCLSVDLGNSTYFLPGNLIDKTRPASEKSYCHTVLGKTSATHVTATHSAANHWQAETLFFNDLPPRMGFVFVTMAMLGNAARLVGQRMPFFSGADSELFMGQLSHIDGRRGTGNEIVPFVSPGESVIPSLASSIKPYPPDTGWGLLGLRVYPELMSHITQTGTGNDWIDYTWAAPPEDRRPEIQEVVSISQNNVEQEITWSEVAEERESFLGKGMLYQSELSLVDIVAIEKPPSDDKEAANESLRDNKKRPEAIFTSSDSENEAVPIEDKMQGGEDLFFTEPVSGATEQAESLSETGDSEPDTSGSDDRSGSIIELPGDKEKESDRVGLTSLGSLPETAREVEVGSVISMSVLPQIPVDSESSDVWKPDSIPLTAAEQRLAAFKKTAQAKPPSAELSSAITEIESGKAWKEVVVRHIRQSVWGAMYGSSADGNHGGELPHFASKDVSNLKMEIPDHWSEIDKVIAERLKVIAFEEAKNKKTKHFKDKNNKPIRMVLFDGMNALLNKVAVLEQAKKVGSTVYMIPLKEGGYLSTVTEAASISLQALQKKEESNPVSVWFHENVEGLVKEEYARVSRLLGDLIQMYKNHYKDHEVGESVKFGQLPLESITRPGKMQSLKKPAFRLTRLMSMQYTSENVVPWLVKAYPVVKTYESWSNSFQAMMAANEGTRLSPEPLKPYRKQANQLLIEYSKLEQNKMPAYKWAEVSEARQALEKLCSKTDSDI
ncbi:hypothetical protein [Endozoicomonas lisbonensis]|uniref:hypothetical protein n=1 Tax=Endozoicomonas lisbonensis TaxID=3120522 RepID=UPI003396E32D